jgi:TRAP-type mannitol/chloroaromatic compound transport system permease large subunit
MLPALLAAVAAPGRALHAAAQEARITWTGLLRSLGMALVPVLIALVTLGTTWWYVVIHSQADNNALAAAQTSSMSQAAATSTVPAETATGSGTGNAVAEPPASGGVQEPPDGDAKEPPGSGDVQEPPGSEVAAAPAAEGALEQLGEEVAATRTADVPEAFYIGFWIACAIAVLLLAWYYWRFDAEQYEILTMLVQSVMPLAILTFVVLAVILFGITTATESAAVGAAGAFLMAWHAGTLNLQRIKEAVFLTMKTTSMVCWLFVGSALFSAVFALLGGQRVVEEWVLSMDLSPLQFLLLSQAIIFVLGWPLEWTEIIVIFVPIFLPLLAHFQIDPILWGVLVFVNLQAAFLSPPVAMSAFYLKGVSPPHVTINQIFAGMMPYMLIVILCMVLMYLWPGLTLWLPKYLYG